MQDQMQDQMNDQMEKKTASRTVVRLSNGGAEIRTGGRSFAVLRKDAESDETACPVDLIAGALGG